MLFGQLIFRYLPLTLLALSPIFVCLYLTRKKRRSQVNQATAIICLSIAGGLILRVLSGLFLILIQYMWIF